MLFTQQIFAQKDSLSTQILGGYEVNYFGKNSMIHGRFVIKNHVIEMGLNYNFSDGFSTNPMLGIGLYYGYQVISNDKWKAEIGAEYRRQKPLTIVNIQTWCYTSTIQYIITKKLSGLTRLGYGVATERSASAGSFDQFNNITGSLSIGCVLHL